MTCSFCWTLERSRDPRWVVQVVDYESDAVEQRLAACDGCARKVIRGMRRDLAVALTSNYVTVRRLLPRDADAQFDRPD